MLTPADAESKSKALRAPAPTALEDAQTVPQVTHHLLRQESSDCTDTVEPLHCGISARPHHGCLSISDDVCLINGNRATVVRSRELVTAAGIEGALVLTFMANGTSPRQHRFDYRSEWALLICPGCNGNYRQPSVSLQWASDAHPWVITA